MVSATATPASATKAETNTAAVHAGQCHILAATAKAAISAATLTLRRRERRDIMPPKNIIAAGMYTTATIKTHAHKGICTITNGSIAAPANVSGRITAPYDTAPKRTTALRSTATVPPRLARR